MHAQTWTDPRCCLNPAESRGSRFLSGRRTGRYRECRRKRESGGGWVGSIWHSAEFHLTSASFVKFTVMSCHSFSCKWCQTSLVEKHGYICLCLAYCLGLQDLTVSKQNMFIYDTFPHLSIFTTIFNLKGVAYFLSGSFEQPKLIKKKEGKKDGSSPGNEQSVHLKWSSFSQSCLLSLR